MADSNEGMCLLKNAVSSLDFNAEGNKAVSVCPQFGLTFFTF